MGSTCVSWIHLQPVHSSFGISAGENVDVNSAFHCLQSRVLASKIRMLITWVEWLSVHQLYTAALSRIKYLKYFRNNLVFKEVRLFSNEYQSTYWAIWNALNCGNKIRSYKYWLHILIGADRTTFIMVFLRALLQIQYECYDQVFCSA